MTPFTPDHVQAALDRFGLGLTVEHFDDTTFTIGTVVECVKL